jgi:hypothetical protein
MHQISTDVLVVGGGTGGTAAAIQASRRGAKTILVSEFNWLGGMLTSAGVCAPDGNELAAWQTGLFAAYLQELKKKQPVGLDNAWVSLFTYHPRIGAEVFADWVKQIPNLNWISGYEPLAVSKRGNKITAVEFSDFIIEAKIIIDGTELGDLLALADVPFRWGWELQSKFNELSAPVEQNKLTAKYPVQAPTWVFMLQDYDNIKHCRSERLFAPTTDTSKFNGAWDSYGAEKFLNYGRLTDDLYMINWPICGNDYGEGLNRLVASKAEQQQFLTEAYDHSYSFAAYLQSELGSRYGLAENIFPQENNNLDCAFALHPYYRESRRLRGQVTITEQDILPVKDGSVAQLPINERGEVNAIAIGNYANDHHYPGFDFPLQSKSISWGGRLTGTPFAISYQALVPESTEGLLVCEKNISVSHIANGSTRLQPVVMNIGQAAGMAAALCIEFNCQPPELSVRKLQEALLTDKFAPAAVIPLYNLSPENPVWLEWQRYYLDYPEDYPRDGNCPIAVSEPLEVDSSNYHRGEFYRYADQQYGIKLNPAKNDDCQIWKLITVHPEVNQQLFDYKSGEQIAVAGKFNAAANWLLVEAIL